MSHRRGRALACWLALMAGLGRCCLADDRITGDDESVRRPGASLLTDIRQRPRYEDLSEWQDFRRTGHEIWFHVTHPTLKEGLGYAGLTLTALYLERNKYSLAGEVQENRSAGRDAVSTRFRPLGEAIVPVAAITTWAIGRFSGSEKTRQVGLILTESAAFSALATEIGQFVFSEQRPSDGGKLSFFSYGGHGISGHTSIIASVAVPLDRLFFQVRPDDNGWLRFGKYLGKGVVYAAPAITGWSRVNDDKHYAWNVVLGLGVGFTMGRVVSEAHGLGNEEQGERNWSLVPISDDHGAPGIGVRWSLH